MKKANPYLLYYFSLAIVCCLTLSVIFLFINYQDERQRQDAYNQEKLELVSEMLDSHVETQKKHSLKISTLKVYQPYYYRQNKYYESELLEDFATRNITTVMGGEAFLLYCGDDFIYRNNGYLQSLEQHLMNYTAKEREEILTVLQQPLAISRIYATPDSLYFLFPIKFTDTVSYFYATYCYEVGFKELDEWIQMVGAGIRGNYTIYADEEPVYSNTEKICEEGEKGVIKATTKNGNMTVCWLPQSSIFPGNMLPLQILLFLAVLILIFTFASYFAWKSYLPIKDMTEKYRESVIGMEKKAYRDALEELNHIMDTVLKNNMEINEQLTLKQVQLKKQILRMLLAGDYSLNINPCPDQIKILFPGTYFFAVSILSNEDDVTSDFLRILEEQLELLNDPGRERYVSVLGDKAQKAVYILCGMSEEEQYEEVCESIREVAKSFERDMKFGTGKVYSDLSKMSASFLESMANAQKLVVDETSQFTDVGFSYDKNTLFRLCAAMSSGDEETAFETLRCYGEQLRDKKVSLLMQQYIFSNFLSEICRTAFDNGIELEQSTVSLMISARNISSFLESADILIKEFCTKVQENREKFEQDEVYQVVAYINEHFADYDLSIEKVAMDRNTTTAFVRKAVKEKTGKNYKDYLIILRIEYAKELLDKGNMTVADICEQVGYGNISYFIKIFRETTGMTPAAWRKRTLDDISNEEKTEGNKW